MVDNGILHEITKKLASCGDYADIFEEESSRFSAVFENSRLDSLNREDDAGIGLRIIKNGKTYFAHTSGMDRTSINEVAERLMAAAGKGEETDCAFSTTESVRCYRLDPADTDNALKVDYARRIEKVARTDSRIIQVRSVYGENRRRIRVVNSLGADRSADTSQVTMFAHVSAASGDIIQTGFEPYGGAFGMEGLEGVDIEALGETAAGRALRNLEAGSAPAGRMPVILSSSAGGTMVHEAVGHGLEADLAEEGMSVYQGLIGEKVASDLITVVDDGTLESRRGFIPFDDEGSDAGRTVLIENGILKGFMRDRLYAMKTGSAVTGNGRRESYRHRPIVRMTNTLIEPGTTPPESIVSSVDRGLFVKDMGGGQVNTVTGDFVFEVTEGYLIEGGEIASPVRNATLIGNGPAVMKSIDMVGSDLGFGIGTCGKGGQGAPVSDAQPTLRIPEITVGGR
ncbi:TldD/PmbA family protein [Limisalsivibrio acetivorans]|uniref:TldD/PmbA family protein n=1 Tax=Limisalsivibrio acetivorans TaxID=1304888 RepID=UPI0003B332D8|nr:TldD/PmbA family protein [Limisalsivibrio acetivorans]